MLSRAVVATSNNRPGARDSGRLLCAAPALEQEKNAFFYLHCTHPTLVRIGQEPFYSSAPSVPGCTSGMARRRSVHASCKFWQVPVQCAVMKKHTSTHEVSQHLVTMRCSTRRCTSSGDPRKKSFPQSETLEAGVTADGQLTHVKPC